MAYLKKIYDKKLLPSTMGMVSLKGPDNLVNLKSYLVGNKYADCLSKGFKLSQNISKINLSANRLDPTGGTHILKGLNFNIKEIDLSNNRLGSSNNPNEVSAFVEKMETILLDRRYQIEVLILDSNRINDD